MSYNIKRPLFFSLSLAFLAGSLAGCSKQDSQEAAKTSSGQNIALTLWGAQDDQKMLGEMVEDFKKQNSQNTYKIELKVVGEDAAATEALKDVSAAADVFAVAHDQLGTLVEAKAVYTNKKYADEIKASAGEGAVVASTYNGELYGYPASQKTYFLYYDKRIYAEEDVKSLESMLSKKTKAGVAKFGFNFAEGYFNSSFFLTAGCQLYGPSGSDPTQATFNGPEALKAAKYISGLKTRGVVQMTDVEAESQFRDGKLAAFVCGDWKAAAYKNELKENYGVAELPTIDMGLGVQHMKSLSGCNIYCVNAQTKSPQDAMQLAQFLTSKQNQQKRFNDRALIPVNKELLADQTLQQDPTAKANFNQLVHSIPMPSIPQTSKFWEPAKAIGSDLFQGNIPESNLQAKLDQFVKDITSH